MTPRTAGLLVGAVAGLFTIASSIEFAGIADAHSSAAAWTTAQCLPSGAWQATLHITATDPALNPRATISNPQAPLSAAVPYTHTFIIENGVPTFTVGVVVTWSDGFRNDLGQFTARKPDNCVVPTTTTTQPEVTTSVPSTTSPSTTAPSVAATTTVPATSVPGPSESTVPSDRSSTRLTQPTGQTPINLPATGAGTNALVGLAITLVVGGVILVLVRRKQ